MSYSNNEAVSRGEFLEPCRRVVRASRFRCGRVRPAEVQEQVSPADRERPRREREPAEIEGFEVELMIRGRADNLLAGLQQARRGDGTDRVAAAHQIGTVYQLLEIGGDALVYEDARGFVGLTSHPEAAGVDPAGVNMRRAGVADESDATLCLI